METLWTSHERQWADESAARGTYPSLAQRRAVLNTHIKLTETIAEGDVDRARRIAGRHLADTQTYVLSGRPDQRIYALSPQACRVRGRAREKLGSPEVRLRTALVTGGSGGIGKGCGRKLCELGYDVVLAARREAPLRAAAEEIGARHIVADASDPDGFAAAISNWRRIDLVVHAAGTLGGTYARKQTFEQWRAIMSANLDSCFVVTSAVLPGCAPAHDWCSSRRRRHTSR